MVVCFFALMLMVVAVTVVMSVRIRMGVTIVPPVPAFYNHPQTVDDIVNHIVARVLDQFDLPAPFAKRWDGHLHTATKIATVAGGSGPAAKSGT